MRDWLTFAAVLVPQRMRSSVLALLVALIAISIATPARASIATTVTSSPAGLSAAATPLRHDAENPLRVPHDRANARRLGAPGARSEASTHGPCIADTTTRGRRHPLWMYDADQGVSMYFELDTTGNVRRLHAGEQVGGGGGDFPPDLGGYSYTAFGRNIPATEPGGLPPPKVHGTDYFQRLQWQGRWLYNRSGGLYNFRARFWSPQLGAFLQLDQYQFLSSGGTLWSWPGQNPFKYGDPSGRDAEEWFLRNGNDIADGLMTGSSVLLTIATMGAALEVGAALAEGRLLVGAALRLGAAGAGKGALLGGTIEAARQRLTTNCPTDIGKIAEAAFDGAVAGAVFGARGGIAPYRIYEGPDGPRIQFRADKAATANPPRPGTNNTSDTLAGLNRDGQVIVHEGRHRAVEAANGGKIPPELGGVPGRSGWLDYEFSKNIHDGAAIPLTTLRNVP